MASDPTKDLAENLNKVIIERRKTKTQPLKWKFAEDCFKIGKFWMYRSKEMEKKFNDSKKSTKRIWDNVSSQIKHEVFGMGYKFDPSGKRVVNEPIKENEWRLTLNEFPYFYQGAKNYILWYENENETEQEKRKWIGQCEQLKNRDLIIFENAEDVKSIKPIPHLQILARKIRDKRDPKVLFLKDKNIRFREMSK